MRATDPEQRKRAEAEHQSLGKLQVVVADVRNRTNASQSRIRWNSSPANGKHLETDLWNRFGFLTYLSYLLINLSQRFPEASTMASTMASDGQVGWVETAMKISQRLQQATPTTPTTPAFRHSLLNLLLWNVRFVRPIVIKNAWTFS